MNEKRDFRQEFEDFMADQRETWEAGKREIADKSYQEGIEQTHINMILQMYEKNWDALSISNLFDFDLQYVENIIEENKPKKSKSK